MFPLILASTIACASAPGDGEAAFVDVGGERSAATAGAAEGPVSPRSLASSAAPERPVAWQRDIEQALADARRAQRPLLIYVRADWCTSCLEIERGFQHDAAFERATRSYVPLWIDAIDDAALAQVAERFGTLPVPAIALVDSRSGRRVVLGTRSAIDNATESVLAFISEVD